MHLDAEYSPAAAQRARVRKTRALILTAALFLSYAYFYQAGGWNQNSRFDLVRATFTQGGHKFRIDAFQHNTGDKAFFQGHFYSDKAPGLSFTAIPVVGGARRVLRALGVQPESRGGIAALSYIATLAADAVPTAAAALCLWWIAVTLFGSSGAAIFVAMSFGLGTPAWAYATLFFGHALAAACLTFALAAIVAIERVDDRSRQTWLAFAVGLAAGWATVTEFTAAIPAVLLAAAAVWGVALRRGAWIRAAAALLSGALLCAGVLAWYNATAFGSPLAVSYASEAGSFSGMSQGLFGITAPKPRVLAELTFGEYRGLLPVAPILAVTPVGFWLWYRTRGSRAVHALAVTIFVYYLLLNASYAYWEGGWSYGPRHLAPALPFLSLALAPVWCAAPRVIRWGLTILAGCSVALTLIAVSTTPQPPSLYKNPLRELWWPAFRDGDLSLNHTSFDWAGWDPQTLRGHPEVHEAFNLGELLGLRGLQSLVPLAGIWVLAAGLSVRASRSVEARGAKLS